MVALESFDFDKNETPFLASAQKIVVAKAEQQMFRE
jgi:hypothetical protein